MPLPSHGSHSASNILSEAIRGVNFRRRSPQKRGQNSTPVHTREAAALAGPGHLTGLDGNEAVLAVAKRLSPDIAWRSGFAEDALMPLCNSRAVVIAEGVFAH